MCPSVPSFAADAHGLLLSARREGDIDRLLQGEPAQAPALSSSAAFINKLRSSNN